MDENETKYEYFSWAIGMIDKREVSWEDTKDPEACNAGKASVSRDPECTPFQWDETKNASKITQLFNYIKAVPFFYVKSHSGSNLFII